MRTCNVAAIILAIRVILAHQWSLAQMRLINRFVERIIALFKF